MGIALLVSGIVDFVDQQIARQRLGPEYTAYIQGLYTVYKGAKVQSTVANWFDR
jgi:hypothetical protein